MTLKAELIEYARDLERMAWRIQTYPFELFDEAVYSEFKERIEKLRVRGSSLLERVKKAPARVKFHVLSEEQLKDVPFYWLEWRVNRTIYRGRDYVKHPFVGLELISAVELSLRIVERLEEIVEERYVKIVRVMRVRIEEFEFILSSKWNYKLRVITPTSWIENWQVDRWGKAYSVKHRSIMFLQTFKLAPNYFAGYRWYPLTPRELELRARVGRIPVRKRTMKFDPEELIKVRKVRERKGKIYWEVDFSRVRDRLWVGKEFSLEEWFDLVKSVRGIYPISVEVRGAR